MPVEDDARYSQHLIRCLRTTGPEETLRRIPEPSLLEQALARLVDEGRAPWPEVVVDPLTFVGFVARALPPEGTVLDALTGLHAADLYLACALVEKNPAALQRFEKELLPIIDAALRRLRLSEAAVDEMRQSLREQLFVASGVDRSGRPMIAGYSGRGQLKNWLRITTVRTTTKWLDKANKEVPVVEEALDGMLPAEDPELAPLKEAYHLQFKQAFKEALASLEGRERTVLMQHYLDGLNIDQIGLVYRVHRATVARWIARSRELLLERTRAGLMQSLKLSEPEYESIMRLIDSQLFVTMRSVVNEE